MKYQEKQKWKRAAAAVIAVLIVLAMVAGLVTPFIAYASQTAATPKTDAAAGVGNASTSGREKEFGQEQFTLDASVGFDGEYIVEKTVPFQGVISNNGAAFRGELQVKAFTYEEVDQSGTTAEYAIYYQELELLEGASQKIDMEINLGTIRRFLQVTLVDETGRTVFLQNIDIKAKAPETLAVAILSERPQDMQVLAGMKPPGTSAEDSENYFGTYFFDEDTFPSSYAVMDNFRIIVADGIDMAALSQEQRDALAGWVTRGGMLVVGTGETGGRTLGGLELTSGIHVAGTTAGSIQGTSVTLAVLEGEGVETLWQEGGTVLAYEKKAGQGCIILPAFSVAAAPMAALAETPEILWETCRMANDGYLGLADADSRYYHYSSIRSFPPLDSSRVKFLLGFSAAYVVIIGPVLYLVLKKLDKREKGWIIIPALSIIFMAGILAFSKSSLYGKGMVRMISNVELTQGADTGSAETDLYLKCADPGSVTYTNPEKLPFFPQEEYYYYYNMRRPGEVTCAYKMLSGDHAEVTFYGKESWGTSQLSVESTVQTGGAMAQTLRLENGRLKGTVTNGTNVGFADAVLSVNGIWLRIGPMQAGETVEIDEPATLDGTDTYTLFNRLFYNDYSSGNAMGLREMVSTGKLSRADAFRIRSEERMLENTLDDEDNLNGTGNGEMRMEFYGFSEAPVLENTGLLNGMEPSVSSLAMYHQAFTTNLAKLETFDIPFAIQPERVETEAGYEWRRRGWGNPYFLLTEPGEAEFIFSIAENTDIELVQFSEIEDTNMLARPLEILNVSTGEWETLLFTEYAPPVDYISAEGEIRLRAEFKQDYYDMQIPGMRVKGSGLLAGN